jgi:predicted dehydrogenase
MRIGVVGAASIFKNRWLKILDEYTGVTLVGVARREIDIDEKRFNQRQGYYSFHPDEVDWVYIPLPNNCHYEVAKYYLSMGVNVLIEKPSAVELKQTIELLELADLNGCLIIEAFQWRYHKRTAWLKENIKEINPYLIDVVFTIPHLNDDNIRYQKDLMGGAVYDLGAYPCSVLSTLFMGEEFILRDLDIWYNEDGVDMGGSGVFLSEYRRFNFYYAFGKTYESRVTLHSMNGRYDINQPFTAPSKKDVKIVREYNTVVTEENFYDCHFTSLLEFMVNNDLDSSLTRKEVLSQAIYLSNLIEKKNENSIR